MARPALRVKSKVVRNENPAWRKLRAELLQLGGIYLKVGYLGDGEATEDGLTMPQLGAIHELGAPDVNIPARPHLSTSFDANRERYVALLSRMLEQWYGGKLTLKQALGLLGTGMASDVRALITDAPGIQPPNAPSVLARKMEKTSASYYGKGRKKRHGPVEAPRALVDTGRMVASITHAVVTGRGNKPTED
jgi:hypothetical protein